jgi:hypothetical protein
MDEQRGEERSGKRQEEELLRGVEVEAAEVEEDVWE